MYKSDKYNLINAKFNFEHATRSKTNEPIRRPIDNIVMKHE